MTPWYCLQPAMSFGSRILVRRADGVAYDARADRVLATRLVLKRSLVSAWQAEQYASVQLKMRLVFTRKPVRNRTDARAGRSMHGNAVSCPSRYV
jgi:hypothetical protein